MSRQQNKQKPHEFTKLPEFDQAMRKLVDVPAEKVRDREEETRTPRSTKR